MNFKKYLKALTKLAVVATVLLSCGDNIGLGESVDTEAPTIEISYPPATAVIRGTFEFAGTCKDDKGVTSVTASIMNTTTKQTYPVDPVSVGLGTWSVKINKQSDEEPGYINGWQLPDGKYEVSVYATDEAGHSSGVSSRTFEIDNTPPVVVLESPGSTETVQKYGSSFNVTGTIAEEHAVASLSVTIYDMDGNPLDSTDVAPYTETSVPTAGGTDIALLRFSTDPKTEQQRRYGNIYGTDRDDGAKGYTCTISVSDNAKAYENAAEEKVDDTGNTTTTFYLYDDVYKRLMSSANGGYGLSAADLMTIINGTYVVNTGNAGRAAEEVREGALTPDEVAEVRKMLVGEESVAVDTSEKQLKFSLNPAVNPTYTVSGMSLEDNPRGTKKQTITFIVSPGLDGTLIEPATVKVWTLNCGVVEKDASGAPKYDQSKYLEFLSNPAAMEGNENVQKLLDMSDEDNTPVKSLTATFKLTKVVANNYYVIAVSGQDADGNEFVSDGEFGFIGALSGEPPQLTFTNPGPQAIVGSSDDVVFKGKVVTTELELASISAVVEVSDGETGNTLGTVTATGAGNADDAITWGDYEYDEESSKYSYEWTFNLKNMPEYEKYSAKKESGKIYMYSVTATSKDAGGNAGSSTRAVTVDTVPPVVTITSVVPSVTGYTDATHPDDKAAYVNGTITVSGTIAEMNLKSSSYTVYVGEKAVEGYTDVPLASTQFKISVDTTEFDDDKDINIEVKAVDRATGSLVTSLDGTEGNVGTYSTTDLNGGNTYHILQITDMPVILTTNASQELTTSEDIVRAAKDGAAYTNIFSLGGKLQATVTDDDGIDSVTVSYRKLGSDEEFKDLKSSYAPSSNMLTVSLPDKTEDYGEYELKVTATDIIGLSTGTGVSEFAVAIDDGLPSFEGVSPASDQYVSKDTGIQVKGSLRDASGLVTLQLKDNEHGTSKNYPNSTTPATIEGTASEDGAEFNDQIVVLEENGSHTLTYVAADKYGQEKEYPIRYIVDNTPPEAQSKPTTLESASQAGYLGTKTPTIVIKAKDNEKGSGIDTVKAQCSGSDEVVDLKGKGSPDEEGYTTYTGTVQLSEGENTVVVTIRDGAGNETESTSDPIKVDTVAPVITVSDLADSLINATEQKGMTGGLAIKANIVDEGSGVVRAWLSKTNTTYSTAAEYKEAYGQATYKAETESVATAEGWATEMTLPQTSLTDGKHTWYLYAMDAADRVSISGAITFTVDTKAPTLVVNALTSNALYTEDNVTDIQEQEGKRVAKYAIAGTWTDKDGTFEGSGTSELYYSTDSGTNWTKIPDVETAAGVTLSWTNTIDVTESSENAIWFKAKDVAGNETLEADYTKFKNISFDFSVPKIELTDKPETTSLKSDILVKGSASDVFAIAKDDILISVAKNGIQLDAEAKTAAGIQIEVAEKTAEKEYSFSVKISAKADNSNDGLWTLKVSASDKAGRPAADQTVTARIDTTAPSPKIESFATADGSKKGYVYHFNGSHIPTLDVAVTDGGVGINTVTYGIVEGTHAKWDESLQTDDVKWTTIPLSSGTLSQGKFSLKVTDFNDRYNDGNYTIFVCASDEVGNTAYTAGLNVFNDKTPPVLTETADASKPVDAANKSFDSGTFDLKGTIVETNLKTLTLVRDSTESTEESLDVTDGQWKVHQDVPETGSYTYKYNLTASDYAGNTAKISNRTVEIDRTKPVVTVSKLNGSDAPFMTKSQTCVFSGKIEESGSGRNVVKIAYYKDGSEPSDDDCEAVDVSNDDSFSHTFHEVEEGTYSLKIFAMDMAGNRGVPSEAVTFKVDYTAPVSTLSSTVGTFKTKNEAEHKAESATIAWDGDESVTYITGGAFTLSGTVTDNFGFSEDKVTLTVNNTAKTIEKTTTGTGADAETKWSFAQAAVDGTYTYRLTMTDAAGNSATKTLTVQVDTTAPSAAITAPAANANLGTDGKVTVSGTALDGSGTGAMAVDYTLVKLGANDTETAVEGGTGTANVDENQWETEEFTLTEQGKYKITVTPKDYIGNTSADKAKSVTFFFDTTAPELTDVSADGTKKAEMEWYSTGSLKLSAKAVDAVSGVASVTYTVDKSVADGGAEKVMSPKSGAADVYEADVTLADGEHTIYVYASDERGNKTTAPKTTVVKCDTSAPVFASVGGDVQSGSSVTVTGKISENIGLLADGGFVITAAKKPFGDGEEKSYTDAQLTGETNPILSGVTKPGAGALTEKAWSFTLPADDGTTDGEWTFTVKATDQAGNTVTATKKVAIDTSAPDLEPIAFAANKGNLHEGVFYFNGTNIPTVSVEASDTGTGIASMMYAVVKGHEVQDISSYSDEFAVAWTNMEPGSTANVYTASVKDFALLAEGSYTVFVRAGDGVDNTTYSAGYKVCNDKTAPSLVETDGLDTLVPGDGDKFRLSGTVSDTNLWKTELTESTATNAADTPATDVLLEGAAWGIEQIVAEGDDADHTFTYTVTATDWAGNATSLGKKVTVDRKSPELEITAFGKEFTNENSLTFKGTASDANLDKVAAVLLKYNEAKTKYEEAATNEVSPDRNNEWSWKVYDLEEAKYKIKVTATDKVNHKTEKESGEITVDTIAPVTTVKGTTLLTADGTAISEATETANGATYYTKESPVLSGTITEKNLKSAVYKVDGGSETALNPTNGTWTIATELSADGQHTYAITLEDMAGNKTDRSLTIVRDASAPVLSISGLENDGLYTEAVVKNNKHTVSGTWSDEFSGTSKLQYTTSSTPASVTEESNDSADAATKWVNITAPTAKNLETSWKAEIPAVQSLGNTITIRAKDALGNTATESYGNIKFDLSAPSINLTTTPNPQMKVSPLIEGTAQDALALKETGIKITVKKDEVEVAETDWAANGIVRTITQTTAGDSSPYNVTLTVEAKSDHTNDGEWEVVVAATDEAGRTTESETIKTTIDTTPPTLKNFTFNTTKGSTDEHNVYYFNGSDIPTIELKADDVKGTDLESNVKGTGLASVMYAAVKGDGTGIDIKTATDDKLAIVWTDVKHSGGTDWSVKVSEFSPLAEGAYTVFVRAIDSVGNTAYTEGRKVFNDKTEPKLVETLDAAKPILNGKSYEKGTFELKGTVTDNIQLDTLSLTRVVDGTASEGTITLKNPEQTDAGWTEDWTINQTVTDDATHTYKYTLTATDYAGNSVTISDRMVVIDNTPPQFNGAVVLNNNSGVFFTKSQNCTFTGNVTDNTDGSGLNTVKIAIHKADVAAADDDWKVVDVDNTGKFSYTFYGVEEGSYKCELKAVDNATNATALSPIAFDVDTHAPESTLSVAGTMKVKDETAHTSTPATPAWNGEGTNSNVTYITNGEFTLSGTVTDTYGFDADKVELLIGSGTTATPFTTVTENFEWTTNASAFAWTYKQTANTENHTNDGTYTYRLKMADRAGNEVVKTITVQLDTKAPNATITTPAVGTNYDGTSVAEGMALDGNGSGAMSAVYSLVKLNKAGEIVDGSEVTGTLNVTNSQWTLPPNITDYSRYQLTVTPTDYAGNTGAAQSVTFYYDKVAPVIDSNIVVTGAQAAGMDYRTTGSISLAAGVSDLVSDVSSVYCIVDGSTTKKIMSEKTGQAGTFEGELNLADGTHSVAVYATDAQGNETKNTEIKTVTVKIDTTAPKIDGVTAETPSSSNITVSGKITENIGLLASGGFVITATKKLGNETTTYTDAELTGDTNPILTDVTKPGTGKLEGVDWLFTLPAKTDHTNDGEWTFTVTAKDQAGLTATATPTVVIDTKNPTITAQPAITVTNSTTDSGITYFNNTLPMTLTVGASDVNGSGVKSIAYAAVAEHDSVNIATVSDDDDVLKIKWTEAGTTGSATVTKFGTVDEGKYTLFVRVTDAVGNKTYSDAVKVVADKTPPTIEETDDVGRYITVDGEGNFTLSGTVFDGKNAEDTANNNLWKVESTGEKLAGNDDAQTITWTSGETTWKIKQHVTILEDDTGSHGFSYTISAKDRAGNESTKLTKTVYIDKTPPVIEIKTLNGNDIEAGMTVSTANCRFEGTVTEDLSGLAEMKGWLLDKNGNKIAGSENGIVVGGTGEKTWSTTFVTSQDGDYTPVFKASDEAGNETAEIKGETFGVDFFPPASNLLISSGTVYEKKTTAGTTVAETLPTDSDIKSRWNDGITYYAKNTFTIGGKITDKGFKPSEIMFTVNGDEKSIGLTGNESVEEATWSYTQSVDGESHNNDGTYTYDLTLKDTSGNTTTKRFIVQVDTTAPTVNIAAPAVGSNQKDEDVSLSGTYVDVGSGVRTVTYVIKKDSTEVKADSANFNGGRWNATVAGDTFTGNQGSLILTVTAEDFLGNSVTTEERQFYRDRINPSISNAAITDTANVVDGKDWYGSSILGLSAQAQDSESGLSSVTYKVGSGTETALTLSPVDESKPTATDPQNATATNVVLKEGENKITLYATDVVTNKVTGTTITAWVDTTPPVFGAVTATTPSNAAITVSGTLTENYGLIENGLTVTATHNGTAVTTLPFTVPPFTKGTALNAKPWSFTLPAPDTHTNDGTWTFTITAEDQAGHTDSVTKTVVLDTTAPSITAQPAIEVSNSTTADNITYFNNTLSMTLTVGANDDGGTGLNSIAYAAVAGHNAVDIANAPDSALAIKWAEAGTSGEAAVTAFGSVTERDYSLFVRVTDAVGNKTYSDAVKLVADHTPPVFGANPTAYKTGDTNKAPISSSNAPVTIEGTLTEANLDTLTVSAATKNGTAEAVPDGVTVTKAQDSTDKTKWTWTLSLPKLGEGTWTFTLTAKDHAGNTRDTITQILIDKTKPEFIATDAAPLTFSGKKIASYNNTVWFKDTELSFIGYFTETGSGIKSIGYKVVNDSGTEKYTGSDIMPNRVISTGATAATACKFSFERGGLANGDKISFVATDEAGNTAEYTAAYLINIDSLPPAVNTSSLQYAVGGGEGKAITKEILTNAGKPIVITGTVEDDASGMDKTSYTVTIGTFTYDETQADDTGKTATFTLLLTQEQLAALSDGVTGINLTIKDVAGNSQTATIATIKKDSKAPTVNITSPSTAHVNKTVTVKGTASDDSGYIERVTITITAEGTDEKEEATLTLDDINWSHVVDTTKFESTDTERNLHVSVTAYDEAGNSKLTSRNYTIAQDDDRPVVKVSNLVNIGTKEVPKYVLKYGTEGQISGTVVDDDSTSESVVKELRIANVAKGAAFSANAWTTGWTATTANGVITASNATYGRTELTLSTGEWTYYPNLQADGQYELFFYVQDNGQKDAEAFKSTDSDKLKRPYWQFKTDVKADTTTGIPYSVDGSSPEVLSAKVTAFYDVAGETAYKYETGEDGQPKVDEHGNKIPVSEVVETSVILGGKRKRYAKFVFTAKDANGIAAIRATLTGKDVADSTKEKVVELSTAVAADGAFEQTTADDAATWTTRLVDMSEFATDSVSTTVVPTDQNGLTGNGSYTFMVDGTGPKLKVTSPAADDEKTGTVELTGSAIDVGGADTESVVFLVPTATQKAMDDATLSAETGWGGKLTSEDTLATWEFVFNGVANANLTKYDSTTDYATTEEGAIYTIPMYVMATDKLGNYTIVRHSIKHNPDGDKPITAFSYPTKADYDTGSAFVTLGGTIRATGTATVASGTTTVKTAYLQIATDAGAFNVADKTTASSTYGFTVVDAYAAINAATGDSWTKAKIDAIAEKAAYAGDDEGEKAEAAEAKKELASFLTSHGFATVDDLNSWWGIAANGSGSWNIALNQNDKMNPTEGTNDIKIRACAINAEGKIGAWTSGDGVIAIHIDNKAPSITEKINQYATAITKDNASLTLVPTASQGFVSDMYLRGTWYIVADTLDESGINKVEVKKTLPSGEPSAVEENTDYFKVELTETGKSGYRIFIKITETATYTINATDKDSGSAPHTASMSYSIKIDDTAPTLDDLKGNEVPFTDGTDYTKNTVNNKDYLYTFGGNSTDVGSGFERVVFYFLRKSGSGKTFKNEYVLDPMIYAEGKTPKVALNGVDELQITQGDQTYSLYAKKHAGSSTTETFTATSDYDEHVRVGGLIYIDGLYRRISKIDGKAVTFEPSATEAHASTNAWFPIAQVIDNTSSEIIDNKMIKPLTMKSGDDGDGMPESVTKSSQTWSWDASIQSDLLPDGPAALVILAFDKAGNVNGKTITATVSNNAPRVAKLFLATDLNDNNKFENDEFVTYSIIGAETEAKDEYILDFNATYAEGTPKAGQPKFEAGTFKVMNKLAVVPELVGGNNEVILLSKKDDAATAVSTVKTGGTGVTTLTSIANKTAASTDATGLDNESETQTYKITADNFAAAAAGNKFSAYVLNNTVLTGKETPAEGDDGDNKAFSFTFWDSTEETTPGTDSQNASILVKGFSFDLTDGIAPKTVINPFYWKSLNSNSIYGSDKKESESYVVAGVADLQGHIELENDWKKATVYNESATSGEHDKDPKVSGKITFTGTAYDEHALKQLSFSFGKAGNYLVGSGATLDTMVTLAEYDTATSTWTNTADWKEDGDNADKIKTLAKDGYEVTIVDAAGDSYGVYEDSVFFGQRGHKIYWTLSIDTEKVSTSAATDMVLTVLAKDVKGNVTGTTDEDVKQPGTSTGYIPASATGTRTVTDGTTNVPMYQMDVVPYITKVTTALKGKLKTSIKEAYSRTALGHYIARSNEAIEIKGFNLGTADKEVEGAVVMGIKPKYGTNELAVSADGTVTLPAEKIATSGKVSLTVSGIETLNNVNDNNAHGAYATAITEASPYSVKNTYAYNRLPNKTSNNLLTDDVAIDVWYFDSDAAKPRSGELREPVMRINPLSGKVGVAFVSGPANFAMSNGDPNNYDYSSYKTWQKNFATYSNVSFAYDELGYAHGTATGLDTNPSDRHAGKFTYFYSKWGASDTAKQSANYDGSKAIRLEGIGIPNCTYTDPTTSTTVQLLVNGFVPEDDSLTETRFYSPSLATTVHGTKTSVYLAYYDSIQKQIRFRHYSELPGSKTSGDGFYDNEGIVGGNKSGDQGTYKESWTSRFSLIAGVDYQQGTVTTKTTEDGATSKTALSGYDTGYKANKYVAIDAIKGTAASNDTIVAVWYDGTNCRYAYNTNPTSGKDNGTAGGWTGNKIIFTGGGEHCTVKVDPRGGVHIAAYVDGGLRYAYLASYGASYNEGTDSVLVDSFTITGERITIDAGLVDTGVQDPENAETNLFAIVPHISYFNGTSRLPCMAKLVVPENGVMNFKAQGTDGDNIFTGNWEVSLVPSPKTLTVMYYDKINIGLWKIDGKIVESNNSGFKSATVKAKTSANNDSTAKDEGHIYGNGTANPILGYAIESETGTYLETAQMK